MTFNRSKLIIANGPLVLYVAIRAIKMEIIDPNNCEIWYITSSDLAITQQEIDKLIPKQIKFKIFSSGILGQCKLAFEAKKFVRSNKFSDVYVANLSAVVPNYLTLGCYHLDYKFHLIIEGVANCYEPTFQSCINFAQIVKKKLFALMFGMSYSVYKGALSGAEVVLYERVISLQGFPIKSMKFPVIDLPVISNFSSDKGNVVILLDSMRSDYCNHKKIINQLASLISEYQKRGVRIVIKRHPSDKGDEGYFSSLAGISKVERLDTGLPIEMLIDELNPLAVIGLNSSSLITLKLIKPDLKCVNVGFDYLRINPRGLKEIFLRFNIDCI